MAAAAAESFLHNSTSPSSFHFPPSWTYDVFLNFRGEDTRNNFTAHLFDALVRVGIHTFRDDNELPRGREIPLELVKAISSSRISIIVFSKNYFSSTWCLEELVEILRCRKTVGQMVVPLFYDVSPSYVRTCGKNLPASAFDGRGKHFQYELDKVERWRGALAEASNLSGWDLQHVANGHEPKFIQTIVGEILRKLNRTCLNVAMYPVGIESILADVLQLLRIGSNEVHVVGIYGMGGIGKTTVAKAIYNQLFLHFEGSCFLANIKETCEQKFNGLVHLQRQLLCEILMNKNFELTHTDQGIMLMKERLQFKRVLIVLDDLNHVSQLNALAGRGGLFGPGSRIIITTRDESLLNVGIADEKYEVRGLNWYDSLELFSWHAFKNPIPLQDFLGISNDIVHYAGGLPLALEVLGSSLSGKSIQEWNFTFSKLKKIPHHQIQRKLRVCFDMLEDDEARDIFLDIACFFIGMDKDYVITILNGCGFFAESGISALMHRCLLKVNKKNELMMHDLIRDMGRGLVREESPKEPQRRSRLWLYDDIYDVLLKKKGSQATEGISLDLPPSNGEHFTAESFARMERLRLLRINYLSLTGNLAQVPQELRWLCWHYCPLKNMRATLYLENLVAFDLQNSYIKTLCHAKFVMKKLKILNLSYCNGLLSTPSFTGTPSLETLLLEGCSSLSKVHSSIGNLGRLVNLNLKDCQSLRFLPRSICNLKSLQYLNLSGCSNLEKLPKNMGNLESLRDLLADKSGIKHLPLSLGLLKSLTSLSLEGLPGEVQITESMISRFLCCLSLRRSCDSNALLSPSISGLSLLKNLVLRDCNLSEGDLPMEIGNLSSLQELDLSRNNFRSIPSSLDQLTRLAHLFVSNCRSLKSLPRLPPNLLHLHAFNCSSLEKLPNLTVYDHRLPHMRLSYCHKLAEVQGIRNSISRPKCRMFICNSIFIYFKKDSENSISSSTYLPSMEIQNSFDCGRSVTFDMPFHLEHMLAGITVWAIYSAEKNMVQFRTGGAVIMNRTNGFGWSLYTENENTVMVMASEEFVWIGHLPLSFFGHQVKGGDRFEVSVKAKRYLKLNEWGVHLVQKAGIDETTGYAGD